MNLDSKVKEQIQAKYEELLSDGLLPSKSKLEQYYKTFYDKFNPSVLANLDGEMLLETIHKAFRDSLVYWLEFKDDEEFPYIFGSILGGSALKYRVFFRRETNEWMTRDTGNYPTPISEQEALQIARDNRDQLVRGATVISELPVSASEMDYVKLQQDIKAVAPDIYHLGWAHKYWSLLFPTKLDDYHNVDYQRFHLIQSLQTFPEQHSDDSYYLAWYFVQIAKELNMPMNHLTTVMNYLSSKPYQYWRIGTQEGQTRKSHWEDMLQNEYVAVGWDQLGDLKGFTDKSEVEEHFKITYEQEYQDKGALTRKAREVMRFVNVTDYAGFVSVDDIVVAMSGQTVLGIGRVIGGYEYQEGKTFPHTRPVKWLSLDEWKLPQADGLRTTCYRLKDKYLDNFIEIERHILHDEVDIQSRVTTEPKTSGDVLVPRKLAPLDGESQKIASVLERKKQIILYGPPGTGKTYHARRTARELAARSKYNNYFTELETSQTHMIDNFYVRMCTFHPAYNYEDFMEGYRPNLSNSGEMTFERQNGIFKALCEDASKESHQNFYLIIDEINRGDIPRIFGELITLLEKDKRGTIVRLPMTGDTFAVPPNVYLIGTMNTADRSIALLDAALRRRFGFLEYMPNPKQLEGVSMNGIPLDLWLSELNRRIVQHVGRDARNLQIGHAYLMDGDKPITRFSTFVRILQEDIIPLLEEYCYEDYSMLREILGSGLIDVERQRIKTEIFDLNQEDKLMSVLRTPEIAQSTQTIKLTSESDTSEEDEDVEDSVSEDDSE